jgi:hypothetical protein
LVVDEAVVGTIGEAVLDAHRRGDFLGPAATTLLIRLYAQSGRDDVAEALGPALAAAIDRVARGDDPSRRADWLAMFLEAANLSDDERVSQICEGLVADLQDEWPATSSVDRAMRSVESCLACGVTAPAIDELERVVGTTYTPGGGVAHSPSDPGGERGTLGDHVSAASALIAAYSATGRLPYGMLAEELLQFALRTWNLRTNLEPGTRNLELFVLRCEASRVLCRLARLQLEPEYREGAVTADCDYRSEAERTLDALRQEYRHYGAAAAVYALAIIECMP